MSASPGKTLRSKSALSCLPGAKAADLVESLRIADFVGLLLQSMVAVVFDDDLAFKNCIRIYTYIYTQYVYIRADGYYNIHSTRAILTYPVKYRMLLKPMFFMNCFFLE